MNKKIVAAWVSLLMILSFIVIIVEIAPVVRSSTIIYVDDVPGEGPDNPAENYTNIQDAINAADPGDTVFVYNGTYQSVGANKRINLIGEDVNSTIIDGGGSTRVLWISADYVNVTGFTITNSGPNVDDEGIFIISNHNTITGNKVISNRWIGIEILISSYNVITSNIIDSNEHHGIYLKDSHRNIISGNEITHNDNNGIMVESSSNNTIYNNNISANVRYGIWIQSSDDNNITSNNISFTEDIGVFLQDSQFCNITQNTMIEDGIMIAGAQLSQWNTHNIDTSNTVNGKPVYYWKNETSGKIPQGAGEVILANCSNILIENQDMSYGTIGIGIGFSSNITILNNNISFHDEHGIGLYNSSGNNIKGNTVMECDYGILLTKSDKNIMSDNLIIKNYYGIITGTSSNNNNITHNTLLSNIIYGISTSYNNDNSTISNNKVANSEYGIYIYKSSSIIINNNTVWDNDLGFRIVLSNSNKIYHNNIINNTDQALDDSNNANQWDNGYPSGGNFWSDYTGLDEFSGPNQDEPGNDGIGDTNYSIDNDSMDNYPLMQLIGNCTFLHEGWNLVSIPYIQSDTDLDSVLDSIANFWDTIELYNASDSLDHWKLNNTSKPPYLNDLNMINHTMGFWIHITEPGGILFEYPGDSPTQNQTITLLPGWNMVGYPSKANYNRTFALNNITFGDEVDAIWTYNAAAQRWDEIVELDHFFLGKGYWVHAKRQCSWEIPL